jgi:MFS family permease
MPKDEGRVGLVFRALRHRNYRLFFGGQGISLIGTWMQRIATSWLVYRLSHSALVLGGVGFASQIPSFILAPFAGVLVDRGNRHRILVVTQILAMLQALVLAALVMTGVVAVPHVILLSMCLGFVNAFDMPARQAFVVEMVENREDLGNAIALNSSMVNGARLLGPSIAGMLIAVVGEGMCFLLNGVSYLAVIAALLAMRITPTKRKKQKTQLLGGLKEGFAYAFGFAPIRYIMLMLGLISLLGMPYQVLMPIFAKEILHGGPHTLGFLMAATGVGALTGAFFLASRKSVFGIERIIPLAAGIFGIGLISFSRSHVLWISLLLMLVTGFGMMVQMASSNTTLQTIVDDDKRGRVMSFYAMAFMGMAPFGSLLAGYLANEVGAPNTILMGGLGCILASLLFARKMPVFRGLIHPIYVEKGLVPEAVLGNQAAVQLTKPPEV